MKSIWSIAISLILVFTCVMIPLNMAFDETIGTDWDWILGFIDLIFFTIQQQCKYNPAVQ